MSRLAVLAGLTLTTLALPAVEPGVDHAHVPTTTRARRRAANGWQSTSVAATVVNQTSTPAAEQISSRFLRIKDDSTSVLARAAWTHATSTTVTAEFRGGGTGLVFRRQGQERHGHRDPVRLLVDRGGEPPLGELPRAAAVGHGPEFHTDRHRRMARDPAGREPEPGPGVRGGALLAIKPKSQAATSFDGLELTSSGTAAVGDDWLVDDVVYTS